MGAPREQGLQMKDEHAFLIGVLNSMAAGVILYMIIKDKEVLR